jgi:hypothetical protein
MPRPQHEIDARIRGGPRHPRSPTLLHGRARRCRFRPRVTWTGSARAASGTESGRSRRDRPDRRRGLPLRAEFWESLRDQTHLFFGGERCYRVVMPPAAVYPELPGAWLTGGRVASAGSARGNAGTGRSRRAPARRHATEFATASAQPFDKGALEVYRRVKDAFDPSDLHRGRLFRR